MNKKLTLAKSSTQVRKSRGYSKIFHTIWPMVLLLFVFMAGCKKDTFTGEIVGLCPEVTSTDPMNNAVNVALDKTLSATFNTAMKASTINKTTFTLMQGSTQISGTVAPATNGATFTFKPDVALSPFTTYTATITNAVTDTLRTAMIDNYVWTFTTIPQVSLSSNPTAAGTTTGAGTFAQNSVVTVTATPNTGYVFTDWRDNGTIVSKSSSYQFTMAGNRALVANFTGPVTAGNFVLNLSSSPAAGGTTIGAGLYPAGSTRTVTASPNAGYTFVNWTENGTPVSPSPTSSSYTFALNANRTLVANFSIIPASLLTINLSSNPSAGGTTTGGGSYSAGSSRTVIASPNTGYTFVNWTENGTQVSTSSSYSFALNANRTLVANFLISTYTLNVAVIPTAGGTVAKNPNQATYNHGTTVQLTATPSSGYTFTSWSGDVPTGSTANPLTVTMNQDRNITATFTQVTAGNFTVNLSSNPAAGGTTTGAGSYSTGSTVTVTASPNAGYTFANWTENGAIVPLAGSSYQFTMPGNNRTLVANFTPTPGIGPAAVNLGTAGDFTILTKAGISTTGVTSIIGDIGVSPIAATGITGFGLIMDTNGQSSHTPIVSGKVYASDYAPPTPAKMTTAVSDMETAYTTAMGLTTPAPIIAMGAGNISGLTLPPGLYKWSTGVLITNAGVTLAGGPNDTWVFQIAQNLTVNSSAIIKLIGGAQAKNIFWVVAGQATLGTDSDLSGIILSKTLISLNTDAKVTGKLLAQTAVTLNASTVIQP